VPYLREASNFGLQVHPRPARAGDVWEGCYGTDVPQLPVGQHTTETLVDAWMRAGRYSGPAIDQWGFDGQNAIEPTLPHSGRLLREATPPGSDGFLIMVVTSWANCSSIRGHNEADASRESIAHVRALCAAGIRTLVVLYYPWPPESEIVQALNDMAWEGGLADRPVMADENTRYEDLALTYGLLPGAMREQVRRRILRSFWCRGTVSFPWDGTDDVVAKRDDGRAIPRDPSRRNGWDLVDTSGTVELFGNACRAVQDDRQGVRFFRPDTRCL
jgi:hypothetical protein